MTMNDRPIDDPRLQQALDECKAVFARYGMAGAAMVISENEAAFVYAMHAPWSAIRFDPDSPLGWRFTAHGKSPQVRARVEGALHTICMLGDFGEQTMEWMRQLASSLRDRGIDFDHTSFGGKPLPPLIIGDPPPPADS